MPHGSARRFHALPGARRHPRRRRARLSRRRRRAGSRSRAFWGVWQAGGRSDGYLIHFDHLLLHEVCHTSNCDGDDAREMLALAEMKTSKILGLSAAAAATGCVVLGITLRRRGAPAERLGYRSKFYALFWVYAWP